MRELPKGWVQANLDKIAEIIMGQSPPGSSYNQTGEGFPLINGPVEFGPSPFSETVKSKFTIAPTKFCQKGDLIICVRGSTTGRMNVSGFEACIGRGVAAIRSHADQSYINLIIHSKQEEIYRLGTGSTFPNVSSDILGKIQIPFPPLNEQKRIADRLTLLLTRIDKAKGHLGRIPPLLKRFRQSVLAAATSGKLTEDWREANAKPEEFTDYFLANILDLDLGFAFKSAEFLDEGTRLLRGDNIEPGKLRWKDAKRLPSENLKDFAHLMLDKGDIVLAMDRPIISSGLKIARVGEDDVPSVLVQRVCRFRPHGVLDINYLYLVLSSSDFISHLGDQQTGTQIPHISGKQILAFEISLPPLEEQHEIVRRVETLFAKADRIEAQYQKARQDVDRLTPALLAKAFRGELVPQDPNDEPASVLLERVKVDQAKGETVKQARSGRIEKLSYNQSKRRFDATS